MPFESLSEKIQMSLRRITGRGRLNENDIDEMMKEVRLSLLEADVNYKVVKSFIADVKEKAMGEKILKSLTPGDQVVKVVHDELKKLMGEEAVPVQYRTFAQNENGIVVHKIVIHSDYDIKDGRIDLLVGNEDSEEKKTIVNCWRYLSSCRN